MTQIEGGTPQQRALLAEVVAGLGNSRLELLRLTPREEGGNAVHLVRPEPVDLRTEWELRVVAQTFARLSEEQGLERVAWVQSRDGGEIVTRPRELTIDDVRDLERTLVEAAREAEATVERLEILRPHGYAWALTLRVDEPHAFLRHRFAPLAARLEPSRRGAHAYLEIRDAAGAPVKIQTRAGWGGSGMTRRDLECCDPDNAARGMIGYRGPPPCPVFG